MTEEEWDDVINNDLKTVFNCSRNVLETMISNNYGRIISLSSIVGETGNFGQANYSAAKAGVIGFTKSLALELAQRGITVNAIAPGFTETTMTLAMPEDVLNNVISRIPMRRLAKPEEIAYVAMFLLSENASYITGQVININGRLYM
jgi:NAD(P)-dependent dehydrogenase (short-subunit alcohol dehydrogenase family)